MKSIDKHLADELKQALDEYEMPEWVKAELSEAHEEGLIEYMTNAINMVQMALAVANNFKIKPSEVNRERRQAMAALERLSPFTHLHIMIGLSNTSSCDDPSLSAASSFDNASAFWDNLIAVLGTEFDNEFLGRDPARKILINRITHIDTEFIRPLYDYSDYYDEKEQRASNGWTELEEITEIIINESGIDASASTVVKEIRKKA